VLGEVHGVRENPLVIRALMVALGLTGLALEWDNELTPAIGGYLAAARRQEHPHQVRQRPVLQHRAAPVQPQECRG
jgi:hypothetical protein